MRREHIKPGRRGAWRAAVLLIAATAIAVIYLLVWHKPVQPDTVSLIRVSDGDTVIVADRAGRRLSVRLIGVDAPELGTAASFRSALFAAELCEAARSIRLEPEPGRGVDKYGRVLGWVWLTMPDGRELLLNQELIRSRNAKLYEPTSKSVKYYHRLR